MAKVFKEETDHGNNTISPKEYSSNSINNTTKQTAAPWFWDCDGFYYTKHFSPKQYSNKNINQ